MSNFYIYCFIKFGSKATVTDLFENGTIYCNPVRYFKTLEDKFRGDNYEGASYIHNLPPGQFNIVIGGKPIDSGFNYFSLHIKETYENTLGNIFSLYCLSSKTLCGDTPVTIDKRIKDFGDTALLIKDNQKFLTLIEKALNKKRVKYFHGLVEYYDRHMYTGKVDIFNKPLEYAYQNEFRIYIRRRSKEPFKLQIGSLKGIAEIYPSNEFIDTFEAKEKK
jgi:hypothetical protein